MHQALFVDEIVRQIFSFSIDGATRNGHTSLCRAARCCKAWKDPALDALWSQLFCAAPLLRLIPHVVERDGSFVSLSSPLLDIIFTDARL